jgi:hypothetical protein
MHCHIHQIVISIFLKGYSELIQFIVLLVEEQLSCHGII